MARSIRQKYPLPPHRLQRHILNHPARFKVVACGRRFGKTELGKMLLLKALTTPEKRLWWIAPTFGMAGQVWRDLSLLLAPLNPVVSAARRSIELPGGGFLTIKSAHNPDRLRGAGLDYVVMDEAAFLPETLWPEVVRPMLLDRKGGAAFLSSPLGHNHFWELHRLGVDPAHADWESFSYSSYDNPTIDRAEIDTIRQITSQRVFQTEYLAQFVDELGAVFRNLDAAVTAPPDAQPDSARRVIIGVDWGRDVDFTVAAVFDADNLRLLALDRFNGLSWSAARARIVALSRRWNASAVWAESNSIGQPNIEVLQAEGIPVRPFNTTSSSKHALIDGLAVAIERGEIALYRDPVLLSELGSYRLSPRTGGGYRYSAPAGAHDDTVIALALAYHGARQGRISFDFA